MDRQTTSEVLSMDLELHVQRDDALAVLPEQSPAALGVDAPAQTESGDIKNNTAFTLSPPIIPEGGYGWIVVGASFVVHVLVLGSLYTFGVYYPVYIEAFDASQGEVAWVGSIGAALMVGGGLWSGSYADRFGNNIICAIGAAFVGAGFLLASFSTSLWHLFVTQGFLAGIGYSLSYIAGVSVVGQWFHQRRGLAIGLAVAGSGLGQFAYSQVTSILIINYGWRTCLRISGLINFCGLLICAVVIKRFLPLVKGASPLKSMSNFKNRSFQLLYVASIVFALGFFMPYTHLPIYAKMHGISTSGSVFILSIAGISSALGRICLGYVADCVGKMNMLRFCMIGGGITVLCWMACKTFSSLLCIAIFYGMFAGGIISLIPSVCAELFGIANLGSILGLLYTSNAVGNLLSAPIGGFLYDAYGSYYPSIAVDGGFLICGGLICLLVDERQSFADHHPHLHLAVPIEENLDVEDAQVIKSELAEEKEEQEYVGDDYTA
jgi:MFS family permease